MRAKKPAANTQRTAAVKQAPTNIRSASMKASAKIREEAGESDEVSEAEVDSDSEKPKKKVQIGKKRAAPF